jgi:UDP-glucuronate 4-epimerase
MAELKREGGTPVRVLVTGGAGFIGSHVSEALLRRGDRVLALDNFNPFYDPAVKRRNVKAVYRAHPDGAFAVCEADIRDREALTLAFESFQPEAVIHLAACAGVRPSIERPEEYYDVNLMGTVRLMDVMAEQGVTRLVFASSSSVYGNNTKVPFSKTDPVDHPISPYAATKKAGELAVHTWHHLKGFSAACLRFFTVYGPRQRPDLAISKFANLMLDGKPIPVYGDGSTRRDYTFIRDIVDGVVRALDWTTEPGRYGVFNLGESRTISLSEMIGTLERALGVEAKIDRLPAQPGDVERTWADIARAREVLGYNPSTTFEEGIDEFVRWLKVQRDV